MVRGISVLVFLLVDWRTAPVSWLVTASDAGVDCPKMPTVSNRKDCNRGVNYVIFQKEMYILSHSPSIISLSLKLLWSVNIKVKCYKTPQFLLQFFFLPKNVCIYTYLHIHTYFPILN